MRMARLFGMSGRNDDGIAGIAIDTAAGLLAGLALIIAIWLLTDAVRSDAAHAAVRAPGQTQLARQ